MRDVAIIGIGRTPVGEHWDKSMRMLASEAVLAAQDDAGLENVDAIYVGNAYGGTYSSQQQLGSLLADYVGLNGVEAFTVEAGDASGAAALRAGYLAIASGDVETALVIGVEKSTDTVGSARLTARNVSLDADFESAQGATLTALAATLMRRYLHEYHLTLDVFEGFSINAHANGGRSEFAMYRNTIKPGRFVSAPMVAEPVSLFDMAPDADGAAAVILTSAERAEDMVPHPIRVAGSAAATDTLALHDRADMLFLRAAHLSAHKAYTRAGISSRDVHLFELHDSFTVISALTLEATGFAERGEGWKLAQGGRIGLNGAIPLSTFGGLKARGNPAGATGIYQAIEAVLQLRGVAGPNQVEGARTALIQNLGGIGSTAITHVLQAQ